MHTEHDGICDGMEFSFELIASILDDWCDDISVIPEWHLSTCDVITQGDGPRTHFPIYRQNSKYPIKAQLVPSVALLRAATTNALDVFWEQTTAIVGLVVNINVALAVKRCRQFGYAFGMLCLSQTVSNIGNCLVFIIMAGGITLVHPEWHHTYLGRRLGQLLIFFWEASIFSHLFISGNRAVAVVFPTKYNRIFGDKTTTKTMVGIIWLISTLQALPYAFRKMLTGITIYGLTFPAVCSQQFDPDSFTLAYAEGWCGELTEKYGDLTVSLIIVSLISVLDVTSFVRLYQLRKAHSNNSTRTREIRLFFQACVQSIILMFCECSFFYLSYMNDNPWYAFASTTFIWVFTHCIDGVVVIAFSSEIRRIILRHKNENSTSRVQPSGVQTAITTFRKTNTACSSIA
uniref:G_PROTEIN_RECEP_F1_2 domain-containing protein n=1 Tax=Steinernema glaseri TaxID=37863 RepID=A0A1I8AN16_9BILA